MVEDYAQRKIPWENNIVVMRYLLAMIVVVNHLGVLTGKFPGLPISSAVAVGGFMALSGFLVFPSYCKTPKFFPFMSRRFSRLMPAYFFIVMLASLGLWTVSTLDIGQYFASWKFWKYLFWNLVCLNFIEPGLPGVFTGNLLPQVDGALWTMKVQWMLYAVTPLIAWILGRIKLRPLAILGLIIIASLAIRFTFIWLYDSTGLLIYLELSRQAVGMLAYYATGIAIFIYFPLFLRYKWVILAGCILLIPIRWIDGLTFAAVEPMIYAVIVIWLSVVGGWGHKLGRKLDLSYEIYLYHWPVIQLFITLGFLSSTYPLLLLIIAMAGVLPLSVLSQKVCARVTKIS